MSATDQGPEPDPVTRGGTAPGLRSVPRGVVAALAVVACVVLGLARWRSTPDAPPSGSSSTTTRPAPAVPAGPAVVQRVDPPPSPATRGLRFTDVALAAGIAQPQSPSVRDAALSMTSGAAVADVDGDGRPDLYLTREDLTNVLFHNDGDGTFSDVTARSGLDDPTARRGSSAAAFADVDADGDLDLFVAGSTSPDALYVNDGRGHFVDEAGARGVGSPPAAVDLGSQKHGVTFADYDRDGDLDLLVLHWDTWFVDSTTPQGRGETCRAARARKDRPRPVTSGRNASRLLANDGTGHFRDVTAAAGIDFDHTAAFTGQFADLDGDGWDDLVIAADFCTSKVLRNDRGRRFVDVTDEMGAGTDENAMGSVLRDLDGDGRDDWFVTSVGAPGEGGSCPMPRGLGGCSGNRLFLRRAEGGFVDATDRFGLRDGSWGWGAAIEDFGNDGRLEVAQTNGFAHEPLPAEQPTPAMATFFASFAADPMRFWVPDGDRYVDAAAAVGLTSTAIGHALVPLDYDGDGDLDILVANAGGPPNLYRNDLAPGRSWLTVRLDDPTRPGNRQGLGARVRVSPGAGRSPVTATIQSGGSYESQKPAELHVGLGDRHDAVDTIEVWWPGETRPQVLRGVRPDQVVTVTRG